MFRGTQFLKVELVVRLVFVYSQKTLLWNMTKLFIFPGQQEAILGVALNDSQKDEQIIYC